MAWIYLKSALINHRSTMDQATRAEHRTTARTAHHCALSAPSRAPIYPCFTPPRLGRPVGPTAVAVAMTRARAVTMDDKVPSGGCEGISGSRPGILALRFALEHTPSQPRRRTNVTLPSLKRPRRRLIDNERGDAEERRFAQRQRAARQGVTQDRGHCQRPRALARPCRLAGIPGLGSSTRAWR